MDDQLGLWRRALAEAIGTAMLVATVIGSGIAASRLSPNDLGLQLLENAFATAAVLAAIIVTIGPVSGAHLNPVVTLVDIALGRRRAADALSYIPAQVGGAAIGAVVANLMFSLPAVEASMHQRTGTALWLGEVVATFGLVLVIFGLARSDEQRFTPFAVAGYIAGAYWFTSSTSFANPAVTIGRTLSDTFAGIAPASAPGFVVAQLIGGAIACGAVLALFPDRLPAAEAATSPLEHLR